MLGRKRIDNKIKVKCVCKHIYEHVTCKKLGNKLFDVGITKTKAYK
ncbi:hypothetical protein FACS189459_7370 [Bacilli bacterium]|nr:hypothetical protein FACS189459_7370 [Bacilli bacterium]